MSPTLAEGLFTTETPGKPKVRNALYLLGWPKSLLGFFSIQSYGEHQTTFWPTQYLLIWGFPGGSDGKESAYNVGDPGLISGLGRSSGEGNGNPLQGNPGQRVLVGYHGVLNSQTHLCD